MENTISVREFKAWLEGFEESFSSYQPYPNKEQWEKIMNKVHQLQEGRADSQYYNPWKNFDNAKPEPIGQYKAGDVVCQQGVASSPGYI